MTVRKVSALAGILLLIACALVLWITKEAKAVSIQINVKDIPAYGLRLIAPTDASFREKLSPLLRDEGIPFPEELGAYSVLFENTGNKAVAGYRVKWQLIKSDGTVIVRHAGGMSTGVLHNTQEKLDHLALEGDFVVKPSSTAFVSLLGPLDQATAISAYGVVSADPAEHDRLLQRSRDKKAPPLIDPAIADLQNYVSVTVSFDGAFFEDGTFVGPDTTGFFVVVEAQINARRDLSDEIAFAVSRKRSLDDVFEYVEEIASTPPPDRELNQADIYNLFKKMAAEGVLRMKTVIGAQNAVDFSLNEHRKAPTKLTRL